MEETVKIPKEARILVSGIQHQLRYYLSKTHIKNSDFQELRSKQMGELVSDELTYKTYESTKFTKHGGKDICHNVDSGMTTSKELGSYVAKEYSPLAFSLIRRFFGVTDEELIHSICEEGNLTPPNIGSGKSGSLFMFSKDKRYILKVIPKREEKILVKILPMYLQVWLTRTLKHSHPVHSKQSTHSSTQILWDVQNQALR